MTSPGHILADHPLADMVARYRIDATGRVGLELLPQSRLEQVSSPKAGAIDSLVQLSLRGQAFPGGFANGHTLRNGASIKGFRYRGQVVENSDSGLIIKTTLENPAGLVATHSLGFSNGCRHVETNTRLTNGSSIPVTLEMLSSFSLGGLTPFDQTEATGSLKVHRLRSAWSAEGRLTTETVEDLQLEPSWSRHGVRVERFGQIGSMPVRRYFPFVAVEDSKFGVIWAVQLACAASWQIELYRRDEALCLSGGLADFDFGHWAKDLGPGESFATPIALLTVAAGDIDLVSQRLVDPGMAGIDPPAPGAKGSVVFNEFCTTWGKPSQENIRRNLAAVQGKGFDYFVIDAGWYADQALGWNDHHGDWIISPQLFPDGLEQTVALIRQAGMVPGIWFEWETCGLSSAGFQNTDHLLKRHGVPITVGERRFWDLNDPWVVDYLSAKVIALLRKYGFGYLKVDYNETIGLGCDGSESLGEGLRRQIAASQAFFRKIRDEVPGIIIENCSSGGHRLEPSMMALCDFASFSDAHECPEIPIIAANLHRAILPRKSQIWAVLRRADSIQRIIYSMVNTFLGVPCLSGDIHDLTPAQWNWVERGIQFYHSIFPVIERGATQIFGPAIASYRQPEGWQAVLRSGPAGAFALCHSFGGQWPATIDIPIDTDLAVVGVYGSNENAATIKAGRLLVELPAEFTAVAVRLARK